MDSDNCEVLSIRGSNDVVHARQAARKWAVDLGFGPVDQTKIVTAASELARNIVSYAGEGIVRLEKLNHGSRQGLRLTFDDQGPGITDVQLAMKDGYSTGSGLGLGLGGAKRLSSEFEITSQAGKGTRVVYTRWRA